MVNFPGLINSPTHPPTLALLLFGAAYSATAITFAPAISRWLALRPAAWTAVVAANAVAMSVYLWHFTAAIAASALLYVADLLPTAAVGTGAWWIQKLPMMALASIILAAIVARVSPIEQRALLAARSPWIGGQLSLLLLAAVLSTGLKQWAHGDFTLAALCQGANPADVDTAALDQLFFAGEEEGAVDFRRLSMTLSPECERPGSIGASENVRESVCGKC